ncbi:hypothetical protein L1286_00360 [Pseudoalteromonas sp. SMS1]|uniref:hypothetical protein n=1 Tax=Pseudoalteromonas sp. SMS1 TaxID=2908894 RepID=UPI001F41C36D|nr:hypothetical protein [Pseudoalteromonas sp. SMS1]MCF2855907.1 hypothetical protein [Pseudoalteromonas sp. SMS1]
MTWFNSANSNATNGSNIVKINDNQSVANIRASDALVLGAFAPVEIAKAYITTHGTFVELIKPWPNATQNQVPCVVLPTSGDFNAAVLALNNASKMVNDNYKAMIDWQTKTGVVEFSDLEGNTHSVKTLHQMQSEIDIANPYPWAMRKSEFEARRQQNLDRYVASGFVSMGNHNTYPPRKSIASGLSTSPDNPNCLELGAHGSVLSNSSKTDYPRLVMSGVMFDVVNISSNSNVGSLIKFPPAEDGCRTYDSTTGSIVIHSSSSVAFASQTQTNRVVITRIDMWGFEAFAREITNEDPFVYQYGLVQSMASKINGVSTNLDNVRPDPYFAWFEGDDGSRGKGVNWMTATDEERRAIACDPKNNIYFDDTKGTFYQWCLRGRSFAGAGNGDWQWLGSQGLIGEGNNLSFQYPVSIVQPMGHRDNVPTFVQSAVHGYNSMVYANYNRTNEYNSNGLFYDRYSNGCFLVCGTANRLNTGVYHISHNPFGAALAADGESYERTGHVLANTADCFNSAAIQLGAGTIASATSGRPDERYYDVIYASGYGGVCRDMRYSAHGVTLTEMAKLDLKVKSGVFRGVEKVRQFGPKSLSSNVYFSDENQPDFIVYGSNILDSNALKIGDPIWTKPVGTSKFYAAIITGAHPTYITARLLDGQSHPIHDGASAATAIASEYWLPSYIETSIAGEYTHIDVIGQPENILQYDDLKFGWTGGFVAKLPDNSTGYTLSKTYLNHYPRIFTTDNGVTWQSFNPTIDAVENQDISSIAPSVVAIQAYISQSAMVVPVSASGIVYGGELGIGSVTMGAWNRTDFGGLLCHNLIGKRPNRKSGDIYRVEKLTTATVSPSWGSLWSEALVAPKHTPCSMSGHAGASGFKALNYFIEENGQAFINYAFTELRHNGTDWGDDGQIHITNGQGTMVDSNGANVVFGTAQTVETLGWLKS